MKLCAFKKKKNKWSKSLHFVLPKSWWYGMMAIIIMTTLMAVELGSDFESAFPALDICIIWFMLSGFFKIKRNYFDE